MIKREKIVIPTERCGTDHFNYTDQNYLKRENVNLRHCLTMRNYTLRGAYAAPNFDYLEIKFYKCVNTTENGNSCATSARIEELLKKS